MDEGRKILVIYPSLIDFDELPVGEGEGKGMKGEGGKVKGREINGEGDEVKGEDEEAAILEQQTRRS